MAKEDPMTGLVRRGAVYWIRVRVPSDVSAAIGKRERCYSLKTRDRITALQRLPLERLKIEAEFAKCRRTGPTLKVPAAGDPEPTQLQPEEIQRIILCWFHALELSNARADRELRADSSRPELPSLLIQELREDEATLFAENAPPPTDAEPITWGAREAEKLLAAHRIKLDPSSDQYRQIRSLVIRGLMESMRRRQARLSGALLPPSDDSYFSQITSDQPLPAEITVPVRKTVSVAQLAEAFIAEQKPKGLRQKTLDTYRLVAARLAEIVGTETPISSLGRADFVKFRDILLRVPPNASKRFRGIGLQQVAKLAEGKGLKPMAARTVNKTMETVSALFAHAVDCDWISKNHARRIRVLNEQAKHSRSITAQQLQAIFGAPLYTGCRDDGHGYAKSGIARPRGGRFWVPLIGLYSGMRLNEICQLYVEDIKCVAGIDFIDIRTSLDNGSEAPDKRLKTKNAQRQVPVHPKLREFGLLDYVAGVRSNGQARLFPDLQISSTGTYSDNFQKWFCRFLRQIPGANLSDLSFHWLRHTFRDALRNAEVPTEIANRLCGWEEAAGMAAHYGRGPSLSLLFANISRVNYVGLQLDHLRPLPISAG